NTYAGYLDNVTNKTYLYLYNGRWYQSPTTTKAWNWGFYQGLSGTYTYYNGGGNGSFGCNPNEGGNYGVGCSPGGGPTCMVLPIYNADPNGGNVEICQDCPNAFGVGACTAPNAVSIWVR